MVGHLAQFVSYPGPGWCLVQYEDFAPYAYAVSYVHGIVRSEVIEQISDDDFGDYFVAKTDDGTLDVTVLFSSPNYYTVFEQFEKLKVWCFNRIVRESDPENPVSDHDAIMIQHTFGKGCKIMYSVMEASKTLQIHQNSFKNVVADVEFNNLRLTAIVLNKMFDLDDLLINLLDIREDICELFLSEGHLGHVEYFGTDHQLPPPDYHSHLTQPLRDQFAEWLTFQRHIRCRHRTTGQKEARAEQNEPHPEQSEAHSEQNEALAEQNEANKVQIEARLGQDECELRLFLHEYFDEISQM